MSSRPALSERRIIFLVGAVQFVNVLDFMIVMPLGPLFARGLGIPSSSVGLVGGSYTLAAAVAGVIGSLFLDRFDRRKALAVAMVGLMVGTAVGGLATGLPTLILARVLAGVFGGPATSLSFSIIADVVPPERRGRAMGAVMGAFSAASVLGVPMGLWIAEHAGWRAPLFAVAGLAALVVGAAIALMPPIRLHLDRGRASAVPEGGSSPLRPTVLLSMMAVGTTMAGAFALIPHFATYFVNNTGMAQDHLKVLYLVGGVVSFAVMRGAGILIDKRGATLVSLIGTVLAAVMLWTYFIRPAGWPVMGFFVGFMAAMSLRNVSFSTLTSRVPALHERARFMSWQSTVQHLASSLGAMLSAKILVSRPDGSLAHIDALAVGSLVLMATLPFILGSLERRLGRPAVARVAPAA